MELELELLLRLGVLRVVVTYGVDYGVKAFGLRVGR